MQATGKVIANRVAADWLTLTTWETGNAALLEEVLRRADDRDPKPGRWLQYHGMMGSGWFSGSAEQEEGLHCATWMAGALADEALPATLDMNGYGDPFMGKATRIDLQLTLEDWPRQERLANIGQKLQAGLLGEHRGAITPPKVTYYGNTTGDTIYIGSRAGQRCIRIYQKEVEDAKFVRLEIEYKGALAASIYRGYRGGGDANLQAALVGEVEALPDGLQSYLYPFAEWAEGRLALKPFAKREKPEDENKLRWLERLAPALRRLVKSKTVGARARDILRRVLRPDDVL